MEYHEVINNSGTSKIPGGVGSDTLLEEFLESIETLPNELRRGLTVMRELDAMSDSAMLRSARLEQNILERARALVAQRDKMGGSGGFGGSARRGSGGQTSDIMKSLGELDDGTDLDLKEIMNIFDQSIYNADEKIQVTYQLSDHVRRFLKSLDTSIGRVNSAVEASKMSRFTTDMMVATQVFDDDSAEPSYILGKVVRLDNNTDQWIIADAEDPNTLHSVSQDQITELVDLPFNELPKYKKGDRVMALYPNTTTFYPAGVEIPPRKGEGDGLPYSIVAFDGDFDEHGILMKKAVGVTYMWRPLAGC